MHTLTVLVVKLRAAATEAGLEEAAKMTPAMDSATIQLAIGEAVKYGIIFTVPV